MNLNPVKQRFQPFPLSWAGSVHSYSLIIEEVAAMSYITGAGDLQHDGECK
jgi:hypothetical protein